MPRRKRISPKLRDKKLITWDVKNNKVIERNLGEILKTIVVENGKTKSTDVFRFDAHAHVLAYALRFTEIENIDVTRRLIQKAAFRLRTLKK